MNMLLLEQMICFGEAKYSVTLVTGQTHEHEDLYVEGVEKTHHFETEADAQVCFEYLRYIAKIHPYPALKAFNRYNRTRIQAPLSKCVGHTQRIRHCVKLPNGSKSYWNAVLSGERIIYSDANSVKVFKTLGAFASAHYKMEHPTRKSGKGWEECETIIHGEWVTMAMMREIRV